MKPRLIPGNSKNFVDSPESRDFHAGSGALSSPHEQDSPGPSSESEQDTGNHDR